MRLRTRIVCHIAVLIIPSTALRPDILQDLRQCARLDHIPLSNQICHPHPVQEQRHDAPSRGGELPHVASHHLNEDLSCTEQLDHLNDKLCVYAYPSYLDGRGVSVFTTPTIAAEFTGRTNDLALQHDRRTSINTLHPGVQVKALPSRGVGVVATSSIAAGTLLLHSSTILLVHNAHVPHTFERESHLLSAVSNLPQQTQALFNDLAKTYHDHRVHAQDIIKTNAFALDVGGEPHLAIFPEASRFNHDCAPNAMYFVDSLRLTHSVHATRRIEEGEEVTISYVDPLSDGSWRGTELQEAFGFECGCERCSQADSDDEELREIRALERQLGDWETIADVGMQWWDYTDKAERLVELYQRMGLEGFMNTAYGHAALTYNAVGESGKATMYARKALDTARWRHGADTGSRAVTVWEEFLEGGAWKHWSWRRRMADVEVDADADAD